MKDVGGRIMATMTTISPPELAFSGHSPVCPSLKSTVSLSQMPGGHETAMSNILGDFAIVLWLCKEGLKSTLHRHPPDETCHSDGDNGDASRRGILGRPL